MNEQKEISLKFTNKVTGEAKLERYAQQLNVIKSAMSGFNSGTIKEVEQSASNISKISKDTDKIGKKINFAFNYTIIRTFGRALKSVVTTMSSLVTQSSSFLEDFNLFQVAFNGNYRSAERFVNKAAKSPCFSIAGPEVIRIFEFISFAIIFESVVFPRPGGPYNKTWSKESPLFFAASI